MYCSNCANNLTGDELYCPNCGTKVGTEKVEKISTENSRSASISLGVVSLIGSCCIIFAPAAFILSIFGLIQAIKSNRNVKNTPGIIINAISMLLSFIGTLAIIFIISIVVNVIRNETWEIDSYDYNHGDPIIDRYSEKF